MEGFHGGARNFVQHLVFSLKKQEIRLISSGLLRLLREVSAPSSNIFGKGPPPLTVPDIFLLLFRLFLTNRDFTARFAPSPNALLTEILGFSLTTSTAWLESVGAASNYSASTSSQSQETAAASLEVRIAQDVRAQTLFSNLMLAGFLLLQLSSDRRVAAGLNEPCSERLPRLPRFVGSFADLLVLSVHKLASDVLDAVFLLQRRNKQVSGSRGHDRQGRGGVVVVEAGGQTGTSRDEQVGVEHEQESQQQRGHQHSSPSDIMIPSDDPEILPPDDETTSPEAFLDVVLTALTNTSPYLKSLGGESCLKFFALFDRITRPRCLVADPRFQRNVFLCLETLNNVFQYQSSGNRNLLFSVLRNANLFERLANLEVEDLFKVWGLVVGTTIPREERAGGNGAANQQTEESSISRETAGESGRGALAHSSAKGRNPTGIDGGGTSSTATPSEQFSLHLRFWNKSVHERIVFFYPPPSVFFFFLGRVRVGGGYVGRREGGITFTWGAGRSRTKCINSHFRRIQTHKRVSLNAELMGRLRRAPFPELVLLLASSFAAANSGAIVEHAHPATPSSGVGGAESRDSGGDDDCRPDTNAASDRGAVVRINERDYGVIGIADVGAVSGPSGGGPGDGEAVCWGVRAGAGPAKLYVGG